MTVNRQIAFIISLVMVILMLGALVESVRNTQNFLQEQLLSHAQDTATSLGLSLTPVLSQGDLASAETMINAIFDRGYYRQIEVSDTDGNIIISRTLSDQIDDVPEWFVQYVLLPTPVAEAMIMDGWSQNGNLTVQSSPGYAYIQLWRTMVAKLIWFGCVGLSSLLLVLLALRLILSPLRQIEKQAQAICERQFPILDKIPRTRELRSVVLAMNRLSSNVEGYLAQQAEVSEQFRAQANQDPVTELWNKRYFMASLAKILEQDNEHLSVTIFLLRLDSFKEFNDQYGYAAGDDLLKLYAVLLRKMCDDLTIKPVLSRLSGADFALLFVDISRSEIKVLAEQLVDLSITTGTRRRRDFEYTLNIGIHHVDLPSTKPTVNSLLVNADTTLKIAMNRGRNQWAINDGTLENKTLRSEGMWREVLQGIINNKAVVPYFQPVRSNDPSNAVLQFEVFARFVDTSVGDGNGDRFHPPGVIFATAERFDLTQDLDKVIVDLILQRVKEMPDGTAIIAINLTPASIKSHEFIDWLGDRLATLPQKMCNRLAFELSDSGTMRNKTGLELLRKLLASYGSLLGLDQFGSGTGTFGYLQSLLPDYIKIDRHFILGVDKEDNNRFFIQSMTKIAHTLDIQVIAHGIESSVERDLLRKLGVDGAQGYYIGHPIPDIELD